MAGGTLATIKITKTSVDGVAPRDATIFLWDTDEKGFGLRVTANGARSYVFQYRMGGREASARRHTIGKHGSPWTPDAARKEARRLSHLVEQGVDPIEADRERRRQAVDLAFAPYVDLFAKQYLEVRWKQWEKTKAMLVRDAVPVIGRKPLPNVRRTDISAILDRLAGKPAVARLMHATLRKLFRWAVSRGDIERSPFEGMEAPPAVDARDRVLSDSELAVVWAASGTLGHPFAGFYRLLILAGQRREEVAGLDWRELDRAGGQWTLPAARAKNGEQHIIPLSPEALGVIDGIAKNKEWPSLAAAGARPSIVALPGLPAKGDVINWTGSADDLRTLTDAAINKSAAMLPLIDIEQWEGVPWPPREWALHEWIPARQATYLTGPGSAGKSLLTQQLCTCIALGIPFMGVETRQAVAIYITCEDDQDELHRRQKAICSSLGVRLRDVVGKLYLVSLMGELGNELITFDDRDHAAPSPRFAETLATAQHLKAGFVALDNVAHLTSEEIARNKVAAFVNMLNRLAKDIDGSVLFLGHPNKAGDPFSGSTAWENQVRSRLYLETPKEDDGSISDPDVRALSRGKANYARNGEAVRFRWHQWAFVRDEDLPANVGAEIAANAQASAENVWFLACLRERTKQKRAVSEKMCKSYAPTVFASMPEAKGSSKRAMEMAMDRLFRTGAIERAEVWRGDDRKQVYGLREMSADNVQEMPAGDRRECAGNAAGNGGSHTPLDTTYQSGAPLGAGAPSREERSGDAQPVNFAAWETSRGGPILAPEPDDIAGTF